MLVLDTVEHVRSAAPALADLLARTPGLTILATSRIAIGVPRERVSGSTRCPSRRATELDPEVLMRNPAVALFLARAAVSRPEIEPTPTYAALAASICRRLDGIPLAIELAAAALRVLAPHQLVDQLEGRIAETSVEPAVDGAPDDGRPRPRAAAQPAGGDGLEHRPAARAGAAPVPAGIGDLGDVRRPRRRSRSSSGGERRGLAPLGIDVESGLQQLAAASLLRHEDEGRAYAMLTTVRADAQDRLAPSGEAVAMRWAHAYQVLAVAEEAEQALPTGRDLEALDRLDEAHDDIREALEWAMEQGDGTFALRLAGTLADFWRTRGHHTEGRLRLAAALSMAVDPPPAVRRKALSGAGLLASYQGDYRLGEAYLREALALAREAGDEEAMAANLNWLGTNAYGSGDLDAAEVFVSESLEIRRRIGDPAGIALALNALGGVHHFRGDLDSARAMFVESLSLKEGLGNTNGIAVALTNLGLVERDAGDPEAAERAFEEAIEIWDAPGRPPAARGRRAQRRPARPRPGPLDEAAVQLTRAYEIASEVGDRTEMAYAMADRVRVDVERGELDGGDRGARRVAAPRPRDRRPGRRPAGARGRGRAGRGPGRRRARAAPVGRGRGGPGVSGFANMPADERLVDTRMTEARERLDPDTVAAAWAEGQALTLDGAVEAAMTLVPARRDRRIARRAV